MNWVDNFLKFPIEQVISQSKTSCLYFTTQFHIQGNAETLFYCCAVVGRRLRNEQKK